MPENDVNKILRTLDAHGKMLGDINSRLDSGSEKFILKDYVPMKDNYQFATRLGKLIAQIVGFLGLLGGSVTLIPMLWDLLANHKP